MAAKRNISTWSLAKGLASEILRHRHERRRLLSRLLLIDLGLMVTGLWLIGDWLAADPWRFLLWWGACAMVTGAMLMLTFYDMLAVIREERKRMKPPDDPDADGR